MRRMNLSTGDKRAGEFRRKAFTFLTFVFVAVTMVATAAVNAATPQPTITISDTSGMAPFAVHVHALNSNLGGGTPLTARYEWSFGDSAGRHNKLVGFNAAHLYEQAGNYTIKLTIINENGESMSVTKTVNVQNDNRSRIYVSPNGNDSKNGNSEANAVRTFSRAINLVSNNSAILLKRESTYDVTNGQSINDKNVLVSTWGSGSRPKLRWTGPNGYSAIIGTSGAARNVVIEDIVFTSNRAANSARDLVDGVRPSGENITINGCRFTDLALAVNTNQSPTRVLIMDCDVTKIGAYFVWTQGTDHVYIGNTVEGSWFEHNIRLAGSSRILIHGNNLANNDKRSIWSTHGHYVYISGNVTDTGRVSVGPNFADGYTNDGSGWVVVEGNRMTTETGGNSPLECLAGCAHVMVRNNIIAVKYIPAIVIEGLANNGMRAHDVSIYNNTGINTSEIGRFLSVGEGATDLSVRNNLHSALQLVTGDSKTSNVYVSASNLNSFIDIARNVWATPAQFNWVPDGYHYVWPSWSDSRGYKNTTQWNNYSQVDKEEYARTQLGSDFAPGNSSTAARHARLLPGVHVDYYGRSRPETGAWTAGAVELNTNTPIPDPDPDPDDDELIAFYDNFETDKGWTVSNFGLAAGQWERGVPADNGADGDPTSDYDHSGRCWLTGNQPGNSDVDGGPTVLTSPVLNLLSGINPTISFARWISCDDGPDDRIICEASANNGVTWSQVEIASSTGDWRKKSYSLNSAIPSTAHVRIRFVISDNPNNSITEAAIDDFMIKYESLSDQPPPPVPGDINGDGVVNVQDVLALLSNFGQCNGCSSDLNSDGVVDVYDLMQFLSTYL